MSQGARCAAEPREFAPRPLAELSGAEREEYWASLAMRHCPGLGARSQARLLRKYGSAVDACRNFKLWPQAKAACVCVERFAREEWRPGAEQEWRAASHSEALILLWLSGSYPRWLRELPDAPALLYCKGALDLLAGPCVGVVGTRGPSDGGRRAAAEFAAHLSQSGITIASGMALGIDREAHLAALGAPGSSIGCLGAGIDVEYPRANADVYARMRAQGLLVSEFPPNGAPAACNFPIRNRIISGLSLGVIVVEAAERSGSLITARLALEQNREVFAYPGTPGDAGALGCQNLLRQGARIAFTPDDVLAELADALRAFDIQPQDAPLMPKMAPPPKKSEPQEQCCPGAPAGAAALACDGSDSAKILACLRGGSQHKDILAARTGLDPGRLGAALLALELGGEIRLLAGGRYEIA